MENYSKSTDIATELKIANLIKTYELYKKSTAFATHFSYEESEILVNAIKIHALNQAKATIDSYPAEIDKPKIKSLDSSDYQG